MIVDDGIIFKNPKIEEMIESQDDFFAAVSRGRRGGSFGADQALGEGIIAGYWQSLLIDAMMDSLEPDQWTDLTYDTVDRLQYALISLYIIQAKAGYTREQNAAVMGKTIAAVMLGLAMNEHGCGLRVARGSKAPLWADVFNIYVETDHPTDFLESGLRAVQPGLIVVEDGLFIDMSPVIKAYKQATGVDLAGYGIANIVIRG